MRRLLPFLVAAAFLGACGAEPTVGRQATVAPPVGGHTTVTPSVPPSSDARTDPSFATRSEDWRNVGSVVDKDKSELQRAGSRQPGAINLTTPAVLSSPIDITGPGEYRLVFATGDSGAYRQGMTVHLPPDTAAYFTIIPSGSSDFANGSLTLSFAVTDFRAAYYGFSIWIY